MLEILKSTMHTREYVEKVESEGKTLLDAMRDGDQDGMQYFDGEIEKLIRAGTIDLEVGLTTRPMWEICAWNWPISPRRRTPRRNPK